GVGFEIESVEMTRSAIGPEEDDTEVTAEGATLTRGRILCREESRQSRLQPADERAETEPANPEPLAAIEGPSHDGTSCRAALLRRPCRTDGSWRAVLQRRSIDRAQISLTSAPRPGQSSSATSKR